VPLPVKNLTTSPITSDFHAEFEAETHSMLRRRFLWFTGLTGGLSTLALAVLFVLAAASKPTNAAPAPQASTIDPAHLAIAGFATALYASAFFAAWRLRALQGESLLRLTYVLVLLDGLLQLTAKWSGASNAMGMVGIFITHFLASCFLPWTPKQSLQPLIPLVLIDIALTLALSDRSIADQVRLAALASLAGVPGVFVCWLRYTRRVEGYQLKFFQRRYGEVKRELVDARKLHEGLFPKPIPYGPLRFRYLYEPMRQIGGDYLYAAESTSPSGRGKRLNVALIDVTGHGIAAALTVNRLCGELERQFAENPEISPGDLLKGLNRYVCLTLAPHSVYATALCCRVDPVKDSIEYASGGHPPAFLRGSDGTVHDLPATACVLGACCDADFDPAMVSLKFAPGDALIAYTDGAIEARGRDRKMLGVRGLRQIVATSRASLEGGWPRTLLAALEHFRIGTPSDDTLLVEISRPIGERASGTWNFKEDPGSHRGFVVRDDTTIMKP